MRTSVDQITLDCLHKAQRGGQESRSLLAQRAKGKVYTLIYRATLDHNLSEDLTQETLMELIRALPRLQLTSENGFWSWVYRTALGKVQHHFRRQGARRMQQRTMVNSEILETMSEKTQIGPAATLWRKEMVELILDAMGALTLEYRTVLTLRCLENQSYAEIAAVLGGTQMRAKMLFYRAKTALRSQLARKGLRRSHFLGALTVFGALTSTSSRSASAMPAVTAASAKTTVTGAVFGTVLTKAVLIGIGIVMALIGTGTVLTATGPASILTSWKKPSPPPWPGPGQPQFDASLQFMVAGYFFLSDTEIVASHDPDQDGWRYRVHGPPPQPLRSIATLKDKPPRSTLILEQDHWVEYLVAAPLRDRPGPEIGLSIRDFDALPSVYLTDGDQQLQELSVTHYRGGKAQGFMLLGFDISTVPIDFKVRRIRLVGHDRAAPYGGCGITLLAASLATGR